MLVRLCHAHPARPLASWAPARAIRFFGHGADYGFVRFLVCLLCFFLVLGCHFSALAVPFLLLPSDAIYRYLLSTLRLDYRSFAVFDLDTKWRISVRRVELEERALCRTTLD